MISLGAYCQQNTIDGHIHLFDKDGCIVVPNMKCIGFCDIEPKYLSQYQNTIPYYEDFISKKYDNVYLLATSADPQNMIDIHKKWPDTIRGFGELKCYKEWKGEKLNLDKLSKYWSLCKYAAEYNLPIFIHFSLYDDYTVKKFSNLLNKFPSVTRDLAIVVKKEITCEDILAIVRQTTRKNLVNLEVFDLYTGENVGEDEKSIAIKLTLEDSTKTLEAADVDKIIKSVLNRLEFNFQAKLRD